MLRVTLPLGRLRIVSDAMKPLQTLKLVISLIGLVASILVIATAVRAESAANMERSARHALAELYKTTPAAKMIGGNAAGVLVFPDIIKGGFLAAGQYGDGVLFNGEKLAGYYNTAAVSFGFQAGIQKFGYALFFLTKKDLQYLSSSDGWEVGTAPSLTVVDRGIAGSMSTTTLHEGIYAFFFEQKGLMGGLSLQGTKITKIHPDK